MAKSLYGHFAADPALVAEVTHLRRRVRDLEAEVELLRREVSAAAAQASAARVPVALDDELISLRDRARPQAALR
jgi:outer membrane murein-binding lipoprotein Lpp